MWTIIGVLVLIFFIVDLMYSVNQVKKYSRNTEFNHRLRIQGLESSLIKVQNDIRALEARMPQEDDYSEES